MSLQDKFPKYEIAEGDTVFEGMQLHDNIAALVVLYDHIDSSDVEIYLEQSVDGKNWNEVADSTVVLDNKAPSHLYNLNLKNGLYIRVGLHKNTATAGSIDQIRLLS